MCYFPQRTLEKTAETGKSTMAKYKLEYIWLDGYSLSATSAARLKSRTSRRFPKLEELPNVGL
jgi:hypothetical protein